MLNKMANKIIKVALGLVLILVYGWLFFNKLGNLSYLVFARNCEIEPWTKNSIENYLIPDLLSLFGSIIIISYTIYLHTRKSK
jgi:hypothetical protein